MSANIVLYGIIFLYGITIGSFLNVCIYRIPKKENIVTTRSHCMQCGYQLKWYDLIPVFSYLFLLGTCRSCKAKLSIQYPLVELVNGMLYVWIFAVHGMNVESLLYCLCASALIVITMIDWRYYEIPVGLNYWIAILGVIHLILNRSQVVTYVLGFISVSGFLLVLYWVTKGKGIGGGDIKLMAVCGLLLGLPGIILAFVMGCILGSVIHIARMKIGGESKVLAFGPYLSMGVVLTILYQAPILNWYLGLY